MDASPTRVYPNVHKSSPWASAVLGFHHTVPFLSCQMLHCSPPGVAPSAPARESPAAPAADPDTRAASELLRLQREREALLRTGVYSTLAAASGHGALGGGCL